MLRPSSFFVSNKFKVKPQLKLLEHILEHKGRVPQTPNQFQSDAASRRAMLDTILAFGGSVVTASTLNTALHFCCSKIPDDTVEGL